MNRTAWKWVIVLALICVLCFLFAYLALSQGLASGFAPPRASVRASDLDRWASSLLPASVAGH